ncbi:MAG: septal ring lytic transglycosylase RlpA family protein [Hyphomicrobiales bacterium]|nr:septal ring lytic transglycosylase RlpA family protein [Hyphomicrobiales bacterium]
MMLIKRFVCIVISGLVMLSCVGCSAGEPKKYRVSPWAKKDAPANFEDYPAHIQRNWHYYKVGKPYKINGTWYTPEEDKNYSQVGLASWYGSDFHNKKTANGEVFDKSKLTAAHRTLPMPSVVKVTNLENGRSIRVRVNDRGPYVDGDKRIIDLSEETARRLGFREKGIAKVKVEYDQVATAQLFYKDVPNKLWQDNNKKFAFYRQEKKQEPTRSNVVGSQRQDELSAGEYYVQAGSFGDQRHALNTAYQLKNIGTPKVEPVKFEGKTYYRVRLGPYQDIVSADFALNKVSVNGYFDAIITQD